MDLRPGFVYPSLVPLVRSAKRFSIVFNPIERDLSTYCLDVGPTRACNRQEVSVRDVRFSAYLGLFIANLPRAA